VWGTLEGQEHCTVEQQREGGVKWVAECTASMVGGHRVVPHRVARRKVASMAEWVGCTGFHVSRSHGGVRVPRVSRL
jgi:hypothetical protein